MNRRYGWVRYCTAGAVLLAGTVAGAQTAPQSGAGNKPAAPMTKEQAKELFRSVDEILDFVSSDTKLPIEHSVKRKLISRDEVTAYLKVKFDEDESAKRGRGRG